MRAKVLFFDIETMANLAWVWGKYEQDVIDFSQHWYILTVAYKWLGEDKIHAYSLPDFKGYKKDKKNDKELCRKLWELFNEADVVVAHNGDEFDIKKAQARFVQHEFKPPQPFKSVDTKKVAKRYFRFDSNKLDDLGAYLGIGRKMNTGGWELWEGCAVKDNPASWKKMVLYNKRDVELLEKVYLALLPWINNHPNFNLYNGTIRSCPNCGGNHLQLRGFQVSRVSRYQRFQCQDCGAWSQGAVDRKETGIIK